MKLIGFKHVMPQCVEANYVSHCFNDGLIGMAYDIPGEVQAGWIVEPSIRQAWHDKSHENNDLFCEQEDELLDLLIMLRTMFNMNIPTLYWCHECNNLSTTHECSCESRRGVVDVDWF